MLVATTRSCRANENTEFLASPTIDWPWQPQFSTDIFDSSQRHTHNITQHGLQTGSIHKQRCVANFEAISTASMASFCHFTASPERFTQCCTSTHTPPSNASHIANIPFSIAILPRTTRRYLSSLPRRMKSLSRRSYPGIPHNTRRLPSCHFWISGSDSTASQVSVS